MERGGERALLAASASLGVQLLEAPSLKEGKARVPASFPRSGGITVRQGPPELFNGAC